MVEKETIERFTGFAQLYERSRPKPPKVLPEILLQLLQKKRAHRVIDLGSGTGTSTFLWSTRADKVIGIEPSDDMRAIAIAKENRSSRRNVQFKQADSYATGEKSGSADIVTCSQSFHWMEPTATLREVNRILERGGIFATIDCDWPPTISIEAEEAYTRLTRRIEKIQNEHPHLNTVKRWAKHKHLENISQSGYFRSAKEIVLHGKESADARRFIELLLSQGSAQTILKYGTYHLDTEIDKFRRAVAASLGKRRWPIYFSYRIRLAVK